VLIYGLLLAPPALAAAVDGVDTTGAPVTAGVLGGSCHSHELVAVFTTEFLPHLHDWDSLLNS